MDPTPAFSPPPCREIQSAQTIADRPIREPTDKSIPPTTTTRVIPTATMAMTVICPMMFSRFSRVRKRGQAEPSGTMSAGVPSTGKSLGKSRSTSQSGTSDEQAMASSTVPALERPSSSWRVSTGLPTTTATGVMPPWIIPRRNDSARAWFSAPSPATTSTLAVGPNRSNTA